MKRSTDRILTTHVGSLVRTKEIIEGMKALTIHAPYDRDKLAADIREGVGEVVKKQVDVGIDIPSDGEYARLGFTSYINSRIAGLQPRPLEAGEDIWFNADERKLFPDFFKQYYGHYRYLWMDSNVDISNVPNLPGNYERMQLTGTMSYIGQDALQSEIKNLRAALQGLTVADAFIPAIQPAPRGHDRGWQEYYSSEEAYLYALADVLGEEYKAITDAGFIVQIDYSAMHSPQWRRGQTYAKDELKRAANFGVDIVNHALRGIPEEKVRFHHCWGSNNVPHTLDTPMSDVVDLMLRVKAQAYSFEAANVRHEHEWMVWKDVKLPEGKILMPGVISHQTNLVEHPELIAWRIKLYADCVGKENVIASSDCGFSQFWDSIRLHPTVQWAKLKALSDGARLATKQLWDRN